MLSENAKFLLLNLPSLCYLALWLNMTLIFR